MDIASLFTQRMRLTPAEQQAEALLSLENLQRYFEQSARTTVNNPAPLPPRPRVDLDALYAGTAVMRA
ncbi:MAG TPA: hypothetical protein PK743_02605 [Luteimonas sp.]|nr:hypothetical protein [Luteimonas sp.]HRP71510.1 hypothetical protein [Luteimonas sp.]